MRQKYAMLMVSLSYGVDATVHYLYIVDSPSRLEDYSDVKPLQTCLVI